jgi:acyl-CoA synthetase (AMP-forming)/AMP-acid ligase II
MEEFLGGALARCDPDRAFLLGTTYEHRYGEFMHYCRRLANGLSNLAGSRMACYIADSPQLVATIIAAGMSGKSLLLLNREFTEQQVAALLRRYQVDTLLSDAELDPTLPASMLLTHTLEELASGEPLVEYRQGDILILTSGTTGEPKCARYNWPDLFAQVSERPASANERWLLAYRLNHFAGLQMLVHVMRNGSTLVFAESNKIAHALQAARQCGVTHISSTPTFWRYALASLPPSEHGLALEHITLGSEAVSASLLEQLQQTFPGVRIVHIYASTEAGSCVSVSDLRPGLPVAILDRSENSAVRFRIVDGELHIRSAHGMQGYAGPTEPAARDEDGWLATGDLVRIENDRILFMGRRSETINVGGVKVHPLEVENVVCALPGVKLARVFGQANPVSGQIVAVDVVARDGYTDQAIEDAIREACLSLNRHARPRSINVVDTLDTINLKLKRQ